MPLVWERSKLPSEKQKQKQAKKKIQGNNEIAFPITACPNSFNQKKDPGSIFFLLLIYTEQMF